MIDAAVHKALRAIAAVGPYFAVETDADELDRSPWRPFGELIAPETMAERVDAVRASLATRSARAPAELDRRVAASTDVFGLVARLVSPALAAASLAGVVIDCPPADLRWRQADNGPVLIGFRSATARSVTDPTAAARALHETVIEPLVSPLVAAVAEVSPIVVWGNVASAFAGAAVILLHTHSPIVLDPVEVVASALKIGPLVDTGSYDVGRRSFRRKSCCLIYRVPGFGICGDCILDPATHRRVTRGQP